MKINLNQKLIDFIEYYNLINSNFIMSKKPLNRTTQATVRALSGNKSEKLDLNKITI